MAKPRGTTLRTVRIEQRKPAPVVLVASGAAPLRNRWHQAIQGRFTSHEVAERRSLERSLADRRPAALILDLRLPELGGIGGVAAIHRLRPATKIIVVTTRPDEREGIAALKAGARGYCDRSLAPRLVAKAVDVVQKGEIWVGRKLIPPLLEELTAQTERREKGAPTRADTRLDRMTRCERGIARLVSAGASNKEIARNLHVAERTVKGHLTVIFRKLGVSGRLPLAVFVLERSRPTGSTSDRSQAS